VILADINEKGLQDQMKSLEKTLGSIDNLGWMRLNVTDQQDWTNVVKETLTKWGRLDILVNNAGTSYRNKV
jgi:NADP-dependent 3-hydroxy acid dehydrogenase YdfG